MKSDAHALSVLLHAVDAQPSSAETRLNAAALANRLALSTRDLDYARIAEWLVRGRPAVGTRALLNGFAEQAALSAAIRRVVTGCPVVAEPAPMRPRRFGGNER